MYSFVVLESNSSVENWQANAFWKVSEASSSSSMVFWGRGAGRGRGEGWSQGLTESPLPKVVDISPGTIQPQIFKFEYLPNACEVDGQNYYEKCCLTVITTHPLIYSSLAPGLPRDAFPGGWVSLLSTVLTLPGLEPSWGREEVVY